jgi:hypothetical protein
VPVCTPSVSLFFTSYLRIYSCDSIYTEQKNYLTVRAYYKSLDRWVSRSSDEPSFSGPGLVTFIVLHLHNRKTRKAASNEGSHPPTRRFVVQMMTDQSSLIRTSRVSLRGEFAAPHDFSLNREGTSSSTRRGCSSFLAPKQQFTKFRHGWCWEGEEEVIYKCKNVKSNHHD